MTLCPKILISARLCVKSKAPNSVTVKASAPTLLFAEPGDVLTYTKKTANTTAGKVRLFTLTSPNLVACGAVVANTFAINPLQKSLRLVNMLPHLNNTILTSLISNSVFAATRATWSPTPSSYG